MIIFILLIWLFPIINAILWMITISKDLGEIRVIPWFFIILLSFIPIFGFIFSPIAIMEYLEYLYDRNESNIYLSNTSIFHPTFKKIIKKCSISLRIKLNKNE